MSELARGINAVGVTAERQLKELLAQADLRSTALGDGTLNWQIWQGPLNSRPLLLLHGGFGSWMHWAANISELRKSRTLWTLDMPGLGSSAEMAEPHSLEHFASVILESFDSFHGQRTPFDLAGFSFGALIGSYVASVAQERCRHFIACGAVGFAHLHVQVDLLRPPTAEASADESDAITRSNLRSLMLARDATIDPLAIHIHRENLCNARFNSRRLASGDGLTQMLPTIRASLCGIWGAQDATAGGEARLAAREALFRAAQADCSFHILDGVGHWAMYEDAAAFNHIVTSELATDSVPVQ